MTKNERLKFMRKWLKILNDTSTDEYKKRNRMSGVGY